MKYVVSVDPGVEGCGVAVFCNGVLLAAAFVKNPYDGDKKNRVARCIAMARAVISWLSGFFNVIATTFDAIFEWPRMYQIDRQEGDQNDLPPLAGVDCAIAMVCALATLHMYYPDEWKGGQVPKEVMCRRIWDRLTAEERARVQRMSRGGLKFDDGKGLNHNMMDGIGIGLRHLGRLERHRVFA